MSEAPHQIARGDGDDPLSASPSFVLDLSGEGDQPERFLLGYMGADDGSGSGSSLVGLAIVTKGAVYSNGDNVLKSFVDKPPARKNLSDRDHLRKVRDALAAGASNVGEASTAGSDYRPGTVPATAAAAAAAALPLKITGDEAVLTVKEAVKGGASFVLLATVKLPVVQKKTGGLLLGAVRTLHRSGQEADRLRRDTERVDQERAKLKGLLDTAINDKRKILRNVLERAALVVNAKKAMICQLQEEGSEEESSGSVRASEEENENADPGEGGDSGESDYGEEPDDRASGKQQTTTSRRKGKAKHVAAGRANTAGTKADARGKRKRASPGTEGRYFTDRDGVGAAAARVKTEPGVESTGGGAWQDGSGGAFAPPAGTQEVSGGDLSVHVGRDSRPWEGAAAKGKHSNDSMPKVKKESDACTSQRSSKRQSAVKQSATSQRSRRRTPPPPPLSGRTLPGSDSDSDPDKELESTQGGGGGNGSGGGADGGDTRKYFLEEALKHIGGESSGSDGGSAGAGGDWGGGTSGFGLESSPRRRRKKKKIAPAAAAAEGGNYGAAARTGASDSTSGVAVKREAGDTEDKAGKPRDILSRMLDDDSDIDDLQ